MKHRFPGWNGRGYSAAIVELGDQQQVEIRLDDPMPPLGWNVVEILRSRPADSYEEFRERALRFALPEGFCTPFSWPHRSDRIEPQSQR